MTQAQRFGVFMIETNDLREGVPPEQLAEMRLWLAEDRLRRTLDAGRRLTDWEWREERESELEFELRIATLAERVGEPWDDNDESELITTEDVETARRNGRHFHVRGTCLVMRLDSVRVR